MIADPPVVCPSDSSVTFTCTLSGEQIRWLVSLPMVASASTTIQASLQLLTITASNGFMFRIEVTGASGGTITTTLTTINPPATSLAGTMVQCEEVIGGVVEGPIPITVVGELMQHFILILIHNIILQLHPPLL